MKRHLPVTFDLGREARNHHTEKALRDHGLTDIHVLTMGGAPTLVLMTDADELGFVEVMTEQGWDHEKIDSSSATHPAYWVRHPSPFTPQTLDLLKSRVFPPDSPCPRDVEYVRHQNNVVFKRVDYGSSEPAWRALATYGGDGQTYSWRTLNDSRNDGSSLVEVSLSAEDAAQPVEDLRNPVWRAVEAVVDFDRLKAATTSAAVVDLVYDAVVAALKAVEK